jgi:carbamoyl-phosphate synthase large subunit
MEKIRLTIAITGLNNTDNPGPGIPVIRCIRESDEIEARIIGLAYENLEPGIYMPGMVNKTYMIPYPSGGTEAYMERIENIHRKEKIDLIIPNLDAELYTFMKAQPQLSEMGIATFLPTLEQFDERHKANLNAFGKKYGIQVPESKSITSYHDIQKIPDDFEFPLLVKGKFYDAYVANNLDQVTSYFNKISAKWGLPVIVQTFVRGTEVNVAALGDGKGNTIAAVPMRKLYITDKGKAWSGITLADAKMLEITRDLIAQTRWRGGMELEMIKTVDNEFFMIEINPRIPAWIYLAAGAGQNIPEALVKLAIGKEVKPFTSYQTGKMFIRYSWDLMGDISDFEKLSIYNELEK